MVRRYVASAALIITAVTLMTFSGVASAQAKTQAASPAEGGNGMRVSPLRMDLTIEPGTSKVVDLYVENITNSPADLRGVANDFVASSDESGIPRVLFDEGSYAPTHSLRRYIQPISNFTLAPKERKNIKVTIKMPKDAAGGGYYGAVRFLPASNSSSKNVSLSASVGTLMLVTVPGDVKEQLGIESMNVSRDADNAKAATFFTSGKDLKTTVRFKNIGNVQESPFGKVLLKKSGREIASYEINHTDPRGSVLPDSVRRFDVKLGDKTQSFGKYTIEGNFGFGKRGQLVSASTSFYVVPLLYLILAGGLIVLIGLIVFIIPRFLKEHDRRLIKKMRGKN